MGMKIPDGYRPITFGQMGAMRPAVYHGLIEHMGGPVLIGKPNPEDLRPDVPTLHRQNTKDLIASLEEREVIQFFIAPNGEPGMFMVPEAEFRSLYDFKIAQKLLAYWDKVGDYDSRTGHLEYVGPLTLNPPLPPYPLPHWQVALDQKVEAIKSLQVVRQLTPSELAMSSVDYMDLKEDLDALRVSEVFSFNADTMHAIMEGAKSIPSNSPLSSVEIPTARAGWFWFAEPYPVAASPVSSGVTAALLWSWHENENQPALRFSAYVLDQHVVKGKILPSTKWSWPMSYTLDQMLAMSTKFYQNTYTGKGKFANQPWAVGEQATMEVVQKLSRFFMMSCLWFRQTVPGTGKKIEPILTQEQGHIERHARKRFEKEFNLKPTVRVIALRKTQLTAVESEHAEGTGRKLHVRFVVKGHPRLQPCGPGRADKKLIFIEPYPKGPSDAPFKESGPKVFAVIR